MSTPTASANSPPHQMDTDDDSSADSMNPSAHKYSAESSQAFAGAETTPDVAFEEVVASTSYGASAMNPSADDVYEFKSSPEDNVQMVLSSEMRASSAAARHQDLEEGFGDEQLEVDDLEEDSLLEPSTMDEPMDEDSSMAMSSTAAAFENERADDGDQRKVPPLRILLPKTPSEDDKPSSGDGGADGSPAGMRRRVTRKPTEKRATSNTPVPQPSTSATSASSSRVTRSTARQSVARDPNPDGAPPSKRPRSARRAAVITSTAVSASASAAAIVPTVSISAAMPSNVPQQQPSASSILENTASALNVVTSSASDSILGSSMPPSPDAGDGEASRSSGGDQFDPAFQLQPERLSDDVKNLFQKPDLAASIGFKKLLRDRWARDYEQQRQPFIPTICEVPQPKTRKKIVLNPYELPPQSKVNGTALELVESHSKQQRHMRKRHDFERTQLASFVERESLRLLNDIPARSRLALTAVRFLADQDVFNANVVDPTTIPMAADELSKSQLKPREELQREVRGKMDILVKNLYNRQTMEAESLYYEQCYDWERFVVEQVPQNKRARIEDFSIRDRVKRVKVRRADLGPHLRS